MPPRAARWQVVENALVPTRRIIHLPATADSRARAIISYYTIYYNFLLPLSVFFSVFYSTVNVQWPPCPRENRLSFRGRFVFTANRRAQRVCIIPVPNCFEALVASKSNVYWLYGCP